MKKHLKYKIKYALLNPHDIFNNIEAKRNHVKKKANGTLATHLVNFFDRLEASVLKEGFRNPILASALPYHSIDNYYKNYSINEKQERFLISYIPEKFNGEKPILVCHKQGGSRLWVAQKHNLKVPVLISEFCDYFPSLEDLDENQIRKLFKDEIIKIRYTSTGIMIDYKR